MQPASTLMHDRSRSLRAASRVIRPSSPSIPSSSIVMTTVSQSMQPASISTAADSPSMRPFIDADTTAVARKQSFFVSIALVDPGLDAGGGVFARDFLHEKTDLPRRDTAPLGVPQRNGECHPAALRVRGLQAKAELGRPRFSQPHFSPARPASSPILR